MKMTSMKNAPSEKKPESSVFASDQCAYPYGLCISLDEESIKKLGIKDLPDVGAKMKIEAMVEVTMVSSNEHKLYGENRNISLQITELALGKEKSE